MFAIFNPFIDFSYHLVSALATGLAVLPAGPAAAAAIIAFTMAVRLALLPLSYYAIRGQAAQARLAPELRQLRQRYARQPEQLHAATAALYRREGTTMLSGCLPVLLQAPFLSVLYLLFRSATVNGKPNVLLSRDLFGVPLGSHWLAGAGPLSAHGAVFLAIFVLLAVIGFLHARLLTAGASAAPGLAGPAPGQQAGAPGTAVTALTRLAPYTTVAMAAFAPLAAGLYLITTTAWTLAERAIMRPSISGPDPGHR